MISTAYILALATLSVISIESEFEAAVTEYYGSLLGGKVSSWEIELKRYNIPRGEDFDIQNVRGESDDQIPRGSRLCWVDMLVNGRKHSIPVTLVVRPTELLPVSTMIISPRTTIVDSMITWKEIETSKLGATKIPQKDELVNYWTKVSIPKGVVIDHRRLRVIPAVVIGQEVSLVSQIGSIEVKIAGKALEDGRVGERIRVQNINSQKRLRGVVMPNKTVMVN